MKIRTTCAFLLSSALLVSLGACSTDSPSTQSQSTHATTKSAVSEGEPILEPPTEPGPPVEELPGELPPSEGAGEEEINPEAPHPELPPPPLPIDALPAMDAPRDANCPYIDGVFMEQTTGQRWTGTSVDENFSPPACTFWSFEPYPQAIIMVRHTETPQEAVAIVDWAAPIDSTEKTEEPAGWSGGRRGGTDLSQGGTIQANGAVYSVFKDKTAVTVFTAQQQSAKAKTIALRVIESLGL